MLVRNPIPSRECCAADCGRRHAPNDVLCSVCRKRKERSFGAPGRAVAIPPTTSGESSVGRITRGRSSPEALQDNERRELTRCVYCGQSNFAHLSDCEGRIEDMDAVSEYREAADAAEMDA